MPDTTPTQSVPVISSSIVRPPTPARTTATTPSLTTAALSPAQQHLLSQFYRYKHLTTSQFHRLTQPTKLVQQTLRDLAKLRQLKLIRSFPLDPGLGARSQYCWQLTRLGAERLELTTYGSQYRRKPTLDYLAYQDEQIALEQAVLSLDGSGWKLLRPRTYPPKERPAETEQYRLLVRLGLENEARRGKAVEKVFTTFAPRQCNDYIAYNPAQGLAVLLVLPKADATLKFWKSRLATYRALCYAKRKRSWLLEERQPNLSWLEIGAVFHSEEEARRRKLYLSKEPVSVTTLQLLSLFLADFAAEYWTTQTQRASLGG